MRLKVRHVYDFGADRKSVGSSLATPASWDAARELDGPFELPRDRTLWEKHAASADLRARAGDVVSVARALGARTLCSYGVGTGALELNVHRRAPDLALICGDYATRTVQRLADLFVEATVTRHDFASDPPLLGDLHLMHRLDTELGDSQWQAVLAGIHQPIVFVPALILDIKSAAKELVRRGLRRQATFAGWFRNEDALRSLWADTHSDRRLGIGDARGFLLIPR
jgi:hypothetical protein